MKEKQIQPKLLIQIYLDCNWKNPMKKPNFESSVFSFSSKAECQVSSKALLSYMLPHLRPEHKQHILPGSSNKNSWEDFLHNILFSVMSGNHLQRFFSDFPEVSKYLAHYTHIQTTPPTSYFGSNPVLQDWDMYVRALLSAFYYIEDPILQKKIYNTTCPKPNSSYHNLIFPN